MTDLLVCVLRSCNRTQPLRSRSRVHATSRLCVSLPWCIPAVRCAAVPAWPRPPYWCGAPVIAWTALCIPRTAWWAWLRSIAACVCAALPGGAVCTAAVVAACAEVSAWCAMLCACAACAACSTGEAPGSGPSRPVVPGGKCCHHTQAFVKNRPRGHWRNGRMSRDLPAPAEPPRRCCTQAATCYHQQTLREDPSSISAQACVAGLRVD